MSINDTTPDPRPLPTVIPVGALVQYVGVVLKEFNSDVDTYIMTRPVESVYGNGEYLSELHSFKPCNLKTVLVNPAETVDQLTQMARELNEWLTSRKRNGNVQALIYELENLRDNITPQDMHAIFVRLERVAKGFVICGFPDREQAEHVVKLCRDIVNSTGHMGGEEAWMGAAEMAAKTPTPMQVDAVSRESRSA